MCPSFLHQLEHFVVSFVFLHANVAFTLFISSSSLGGKDRDVDRVEKKLKTAAVKDTVVESDSDENIEAPSQRMG
jgi:hypothetical protein